MTHSKFLEQAQGRVGLALQRIAGLVKVAQAEINVVKDMPDDYVLHAVSDSLARLAAKEATVYRQSGPASMDKLPDGQGAGYWGPDPESAGGELCVIPREALNELFAMAALLEEITVTDVVLMGDPWRLGKDQDRRERKEFEAKVRARRVLRGPGVK